MEWRARLVDAGLRRGLDRRHHRRGGADPGRGRDGPPRRGDPARAAGRPLPRHARHRPRQRAGRARRRASTIVDSSAGGLGGCPYAPGASGNLATEDLLYMLHGMGIETGVDLAAVASASRALAPRLGRALPCRYLQAGPRGAAEGGRVSETATILVVDDLPANRDLLTRRLERSGFRVVSAASGPEALELVRRAPRRPGAARHHDAGDDRARRAEDPAPGALGGRPARDHGDREDRERGRGRGAVARGQRLRDEAARLPGGAGADPEGARDPPGRAGPVGASRASRAARPTRCRERSSAAATGSTRSIGGGSFGTVFRARHLELDRDVAVKVLATSAGTDPEALARFRREGKSACRVQHPNAVSVLDFGVNVGGVAYLVMELLHGRSLEKELEDQQPS